MVYNEQSPRQLFKPRSHTQVNSTHSSPTFSTDRMKEMNVHQLQKHLGNQAVGQSIITSKTPPMNTNSHSIVSAHSLHSSSPIQRKLGEAYIPQDTPSNKIIRDLLVEYETHLENYMNQVSAEVDKARQLIITRAFANIPAVDGYMNALLENFDTDTLTFGDYRKIGRQAGYWIESYVTKVINVKPADGLRVIYQAKRGDTRPDIVVSALIDKEKDQYLDIAWLDITSSSEHSTDHILKKAGDWGQALYARELLYDPIQISPTDRTAVPAPDADLTKLSEQAKLLQEETQKRHLILFQRHASNLYKELERIYNEVKREAINYVEPNPFTLGISRESHHIKKPTESLTASGRPKRKAQTDKDTGFYAEKETSTDLKYASWTPSNEYFLASKSFFEDYTGHSGMTQKEIASFIMGWNGMLSRYDERTKTTNFSKFSLSKSKAGVDILDASGADGEVLVYEWL